METRENLVRIHRRAPVRIVIEGATEEFAEKVVALAARHQAELSVTTVRPGWTVDRAERYLRSLPAGGRRMAELVVDGGGYIDADRLRRALGKLNGPSNALTRAVPRGVRKGWWPEGTPAPITPVSNPDNPSWHQNIAYRMDEELVPAFRQALTRIHRSATAAPATGRGVSTAAEPTAPWSQEAPSAFAVPPGWDAGDDAPRALDLLDEKGAGAGSGSNSEQE